jgi:hypothetical protein
VYSADLSSSRAWIEAGEKLMKQEVVNMDEGIDAAKKGNLEGLKKLVMESAWNPHSAVDKHGSTGNYSSHSITENPFIENPFTELMTMPTLDSVDVGVRRRPSGNM